jgi:hypothetical protein
MTVKNVTSSIKIFKLCPAQGLLLSNLSSTSPTYKKHTVSDLVNEKAIIPALPQKTTNRIIYCGNH